jgi:hypothetical protein
MRFGIRLGFRASDHLRNRRVFPPPTKMRFSFKFNPQGPSHCRHSAKASQLMSNVKGVLPERFVVATALRRRALMR